MTFIWPDAFLKNLIFLPLCLGQFLSSMGCDKLLPGFPQTDHNKRRKEAHNWLQYCSEVTKWAVRVKFRIEPSCYLTLIEQHYLHLVFFS